MNVSLSKAWNWWTPNAQLWIYLCIFRSWSELRSYMLPLIFFGIAAFVFCSSFGAKQQHAFCSVLAARICSWTWWKFVPIPELLRSRKKRGNLQHVDGASEFGLEVSIINPWSSRRIMLLLCSRVGFERLMEASLAYFLASILTNIILTYQGSAKTCHQHLLHIWVWCKPMLSSLAVK